MADRLQLAERSAEGLPLVRVRDGRVEGRLRHPDRERADTGPEQVEGAHRHREAPVRLSEQVGALDPHTVEDEPADRVRRQHVEMVTAEAFSVAGDDEGGDASLPASAVVRAKTE